MKTTQDLFDARSSGVEAFAFENRSLILGQWIDVKDTIDHWLEAEVIDVDERNKRVLVHYNEWSSRWDEWLDMSSKRIAPFRTQTVQNGYGFYMSPAPEKNLEGDTKLASPNERDFDEVTRKVFVQVENMKKMLSSL